MKTLFILSLALFASSAQAGIITNKAYLLVDNQSDTLFGVDALPLFACAGEALNVQMLSFEAAKSVKDLASGVYACEGDFITYRATGNGQPNAEESVQVFRLGKCEKVTNEEMENACK
jgi:hypothetical protein